MHIGALTLVVRDYDEARDWYTRVLGFELLEDTPLGGGKRWLLVAPPGSRETALLLAKAATPEQAAAIGHQAGGRVLLSEDPRLRRRPRGHAVARRTLFGGAPTRALWLCGGF